MKKGCFVIVMLVLMAMPTFVFGQAQGTLDRFEFGIYPGLGFYVGPNKDVLGVQHIQAYAGRSTLKWPGIESFGFSVGYRYDLRWNFKLQTMRQRMAFEEVVKQPTRNRKDLYYNAMWHVDAMAEFNILRHGKEMMPLHDVYSIVPFVGLGYGLTVYNEEATLRNNPAQGDPNKEGKDYEGTRYPRVGYNMLDNDGDGKFTNPEKAKTDLAMYIPIAAGVKWRIGNNVQLKGTVQYHMYLQGAAKEGVAPKINSNICGGTLLAPNDKVYGAVVGSHHNIMLSLGVIVNLGEWDEDLTKKNVNY